MLDKSNGIVQYIQGGLIMTTSVLLAIHSLLLVFCIIKILILERRLHQTGNNIRTIIDMIRKAAKTEDEED